MRKNIEHILQVVSDYHDFCNDGQVSRKQSNDSGELSMEELDMIAAAGKMDEIPSIEKLLKAAKNPLK